MTIKQRFSNFSKRIRPTGAHFNEAMRQVDWMIDNLHDKVAGDGTFTLEKVLKAGSNAKHTSLLRTEENEFDVDLGAYYIGSGASKKRLDTLLEFTHQRLSDIYPNKDADDFTILNSAVRVIFTSGIKLQVDIAPIIKDESLSIDNAGWIPRDDGWRLTSVTGHNDFVTSRTLTSKKQPGPVHFNRLVRMIKWWNNLQGDLVQPSIFCELVTAAAVRDAGGVTDEWQSSIRNVFSYLRKERFATPIVFDDYYDSRKVAMPSDTVVVLDSVNPKNNITEPWTTATRDAFLDKVEGAYVSAIQARSAELDGDDEAAVGFWCDIFDEAFRVLSEDEEAA